MTEEEYEIIPTSPLRRLEKRIEKIETGSYSSEVRRLIEQVMDLVRSNQKIIDEVIKSNSDLINEISKIPAKVDELLSEMRSFMTLLKESATEEEVASISKEVMQPLVDKLGELVEHSKKNFETNQAVLTTLAVIEKRLKRVAAAQQQPIAQPQQEYQYPQEYQGYQAQQQ
ncbi:MAG TPA: hypothetical protein ENG42_01090 [Candidatus Aenigmarchaeota archaeon]|nr:MAG: hypothetical protein DRP03_03475 [Candidatus Aenigmarchaeota archaeon]HDD46046.1 hypothetical protein [Candidatus Aenigmarchaeota archaeon]